MSVEIQHAMDLLGVTQGTVAQFWLLPGRKVTRITWEGCMATDLKVQKIGKIVRRESRWQCDGKLVKYEELRLKVRRREWPGIIVKYPDGEQWESCQSIRITDDGSWFGSIEVWR